jgi:hypothetical protein
MESLGTVPLLVIDDLGMRKLPLTAAEGRPTVLSKTGENC